MLNELLSLDAQLRAYDVEEEQFEAEQAGEIAAENAWLIAAETPDNDALGFYAWEQSRISPDEYARYYG